MLFWTLFSCIMIRHMHKKQNKTVIKRENFTMTIIYFFSFPFVRFVLFYAAEFHIHQGYKQSDISKVSAHLLQQSHSSDPPSVCGVELHYRFCKLLYKLLVTHIPHCPPWLESEVIKTSEATVQYYITTWWLASFSLFTLYMEYHWVFSLFYFSCSL